MGRYRTKYNKKKYDLPKRKSYRSRFADKKINTSIEKKILAIAKREDQKNIKYYIKKYIITADGAGWVANIAKPLATAYLVMAQSQVQYVLLSGIGGYAPVNTIASATAAPGSGSNLPGMINQHFKVKRVQANMNFCNTSQQTVKVRVALVFIPNLNNSTDDGVDHLTPDIHMLGDVNNKFKGMFKDELKANATWSNSKTQVTILATKTITLPPARVDQVDLEDGIATYRTEEKFRQINISKTYKDGKSLYWNNNSVAPIPILPQLCSNGNIYMVFSHDCAAVGAGVSPSAIFAYGVAGIRFRIKNQMVPINVPGGV